MKEPRPNPIEESGEPPQETRKRFWAKRLGTSAGLFLLGVLAGLVALGVFDRIQSKSPELSLADVNQSISRAIEEIPRPPAYSAQVYEQIKPSIVIIESHYDRSNGRVDYQFGTGVVININGDILTSLHVVADASEVLLTFAEGTQSKAAVVDEQPENDLAVLRALKPPSEIVPATLGDPNQLQVGDEAYVVGHSFGLYSSMTAGVISGFERTFELRNTRQTLEGLIQIDAAVNPGNSGGPLLNRDGEVVGIVTALLNPTDDEFFVGIGFAVPLTSGQGLINLPPY